MSDMLERVATALHNASALEKDGPGVLSLSTCRLIARTAIDAMREPTDAMKAVGDNGEWQAMIDEALK